MADRRRQKQRRRDDMLEKPSKEEYAVAKYLRFNLPTKQGKLVGITVQYFVASKAVDMLLESKWGAAKSKDQALFITRSGCADYLDNLLQKGIFHRAAKIEKKKDRDREKKKKKPTKDEEESVKEEEKKVKKEKKGKKKEEKDEQADKENEKEKEKEKEKESEEEKKEDEKKKKKKVRLEMHNMQVFKDGKDEVYVWIYDPVPMKTFIIGLLLVLGAIAVCLFPLWPPEVRLGVYYLSLAAAGFVGLMLALCVVRLILFCLVWCATFGKHYLWILPNLTEDVGFFDSFKPLYKHDVYAAPEIKKDKDEKTSESEEKKDEKSETQKTIKDSEEKIEDKDNKDNSEKEESGSENDNGYEFVDKNDFEEEENEENEENEEENQPSGSEGEDEEPKKDK